VKYYGTMITKTSVVFSTVAIAAGLLLAGTGSVLAAEPGGPGFSGPGGWGHGGPGGPGFGGDSGINVQTDIDQKQECETAGGTSLITDSCHATSTNTVTQSGGIH
jgi:hypothetical protein